MNRLTGVKIFEDPKLLVLSHHKDVRRTFRERFFTRPWTPWQATKSVPVYRPDDTIYYMRHTNTYVMHPETKKLLENGDDLICSPKMYDPVSKYDICFYNGPKVFDNDVV